MNIQTQPQRTPAETALIDAFGERVSYLPGDSVVTVKRDEAIEALKTGLPNRKVEAWHYTDLRRLLATVPAWDGTLAAEACEPLVAGSSVLAVLNGQAGKVGTIDGLTVERLADKLTDGSLADTLGTLDAADAVGAINTAYVADGFALAIASGAALDAPVELQNVQAGGQTHVRFDVRAGAGSKATIVERQTGTADALATSISSLDVADGAEVVWIILQEQPDDATHLARFQGRLGKDARLTLFIMNAGGKLVRQEVNVDAAGEGADFQLRGVNLLAGETHSDITMQLDHSREHTTSTEVLRNVVTDRAQGVFQGQIRVAQRAQKTDARMACNTLLLSDDGEFSTKPELEIFADDVACGHGATVTEIDHNHLFYLMARGVPEKDARGLLVKAFLAEVIEELDDEVVIEALEARLNAWFDAHG
ncbi:Fe-S cluster assembly protein SufD [Mesorhizobium xinjiangense]|uniref:Fe-S cluster assembly protein SufD n=1 Tax=Mesorhizobium xinjiangense TaxID=2678685 RepID=UPI0012EE6AEC|nr:Fe-S cluster assembly protein SufD [Mesorhizobium xinjiangense]